MEMGKQVIDQAEIHIYANSNRQENHYRAIHIMQEFFLELPDKIQAWQDLHKLTQDEDYYVRRGAAESLGSAFAHVPDKALAWQDLHKLTQDEEIYMQMYAYHSLG